MKTPRRSVFERCALASGLLTQEQLDKARAVLARLQRDLENPPTADYDRRLADKLVELGSLNVWQAKQLLDGRTKFNLGPYWIIDYLGQGGMGQVFKAEHGVLGRIVAVKVLPRSRSTPEAIANFNREMRAQARLDHENLVRAFDAGEDGNVCYLVTEYVPGSDLRKLVRSLGPLSMQEAARTISQIARGLQHAHDQGLVHRDVKPGNILVSPEGVAKLSDLGLAGPLEGGKETDPRFGRIVGTADYLSPDHIQSPWEPKPAWDIYSLGCTLYYAVTGKVPFPGGTTADKAQAHLKLRPLDPCRLNPGLSPQFVETLADMMAKDPSERIGSASEVAARLAPWVGERAASPAGSRSSHLVEPALAIPPGMVPSSSGASYPVPRDLPGMDDTEATFPELPELSPSQKEGASQISQATQPIAAATEETDAELRLTPAEAQGLSNLLGPLALLVGFPLAVVLMFLLAWGLLRF